MSRTAYRPVVTFAVITAAALCTAASLDAQGVIGTIHKNREEQTALVGQRPEWAVGVFSSPSTRFIIGPGAHRPYYAYEDEDVRVARKKSGAPGKVAGLVYEHGTKHPVPYVTVRLTSTEPQYEILKVEARTDSAGYYEFKAVEPGTWELSVIADRLKPVYAPPRVGRRITVAKRQLVAAAPIELRRTACVKGQAAWSDGYVLYDAPITVSPEDSSLLSRTGLLNGVGAFDVCGAPTDSVMVWMHLRDGRSLGRSTRLVDGHVKTVQYRPDALDKMEGCLLQIRPVLNDGTPVKRAKVTVVGRRFEQGDRPALVFVRETLSDADGEAELKVPFGVYEVLVVNPREGQTGRVERMVVDTTPKGGQPLRVVLRGTSTARERQQMHENLIDRAETYLYVWTQ